MCFDRGSSPPILAGPREIAETSQLVIESGDGTRFAAFEARPKGEAQGAVLVLPDVRGLHPYYEELACRFAQHGYRALAIDWFGRTAGPEPRSEDFEYRPHVDQTTFDGLTADIRAGAARLRADGGADPLFAIGFCFGGKLAFLSATLGLDLDGVIGLHAGLGPRNDVPTPGERAAAMRSPVLGLFGGADPSIPTQDIDSFDAALTAAGVEHRFVTYPDAPHSFFDRKFEEFAAQNAAAWDEILALLGRPQGVVA